MGGGLRIDGGSNFIRRKTLRKLKTLKEEGSNSRATKPDTPKDKKVKRAAIAVKG
jgi:hypothetical protein